jgi:hypothetical protein
VYYPLKTDFGLAWVHPVGQDRLFVDFGATPTESTVTVAGTKYQWHGHLFKSGLKYRFGNRDVIPTEEFRQKMEQKLNEWAWENQAKIAAANTLRESMEELLEAR